MPSTVARPLTRDEVMTAREVAALLHMPVSTIYDLARRGELPARQLGRTWRFFLPQLEELLLAGNPVSAQRQNKAATNRPTMTSTDRRSDFDAIS